LTLVLEIPAIRGQVKSFMLLKGTIRIDRRTKNLVKRLRRGEIAVIDHRDLDSVAATSLVESGVRAVVNASEFISGRYPNRGPAILARAGVVLIDHVGAEAMTALHEGDTAEIDITTAEVRCDGTRLRGTLLTPELIDQKLAETKENVREELRKFVQNTLNYVAQEEHVLIESLELPDLRTPLAGRHALVVVRGEGYREDLRAIRGYVEEMRPVIIAVDGGADAVLEERVGWFGLQRIKPDIILGDMDSVSDAALKCGAELIVHAYADGRAPGLERLERLGLPAKVIKATGTSEDVALLLAHEKGAELIVGVGTHSSLEDFLDKGRRGFASTFLTRLKVGTRLIDAKGVSKLYGQGMRPLYLLLLLCAGLISTVIVLMSSPQARHLIKIWGTQLELCVRSLRGL
jgi:uncharacterized membrane-anchored protein